VGKGKKYQKYSRARPRHATSLRFEIEENAEELLAQYLEAIPEDIGRLREQDLEISHEKKSPSPAPLRHFILDLHGYSLAEAESETTLRISQLLQAKAGPFSLKVITGRGIHSGQSGSILVREIYRFILSTFRANIAKIDAPPAESTIDGLPLRGFFLVHFTST
jgi:DNA-nicking Smr family endonuclease